MHPAYLEVFKDAFFSNFILTFQKEIGFPLLVYFDFYDNSLGLIIALLGSVLGLVLTFFIFSFLATKFHSFLDKSVSYEPFCDTINTYKYIALIPVVLPEMSILVPFFAGMVKMDRLKFIAICIIYRLAFYLTILYYPNIYW